METGRAKEKKRPGLPGLFFPESRDRWDVIVPFVKWEKSVPSGEDFSPMVFY